ncbi:hypothetical protein Fmac_017902 [Flemingia macrophylla]|uniref:Retrotransposon gag domain-containing protein n=1 Tax=Flemingia macrophylla TaxID=520843 RepID=A0ABD1M3J3_9FABA
MAGRNDKAIVDAFQALAHTLGQNRAADRVAHAPSWLERFQRHSPPKFKGEYDPDVTMRWMTEVEKIFAAMECPLIQRVNLATFLLVDDAHFWWEGARQRMVDARVPMNWDNFKRTFLEKYFPEDVRSMKEVEFLELKQGDNTVAEYAAKFDELVRYCLHYQGEAGERAKCIKFVNGLRPDVKIFINYQ